MAQGGFKLLIIHSSHLGAEIKVSSHPIQAFIFENSHLRLAFCLLALSALSSCPSPPTNTPPAATGRRVFS